MTLPLMTWPVLIALGAGIMTFGFPRAVAKWSGVLVSAVVFGLCIQLYRTAPTAAWQIAGCTVFSVDHLSLLVLLGVGFFGLMMTIYSAGFFKKVGTVSDGYYYANLLLSIGAGCGIALSGNLLVLAVFWGLLSIPLYLLVNAGSADSPAAAKKSMLVLGATDSILILGIAAFAVCKGVTSGIELNAFDMFGGKIVFSGASVMAAWISMTCIIIAALAKAGAMPFHTWVPDVSETAPVPVVAMLPASLDKLLGIYLLARVFLTLYEIPDGVRIACMLVGAGTIVFAVMAAMVQHNLRRLLGFHAVSQVGYMVVGVATGSAIGIVGGLFHMVNHAIYKSCLFLTAGAAERKTGETELDKMGGLAKTMPLTFIAAVIAAFSISGVPPMNGFASKWMVYNGILGARELGPVWIVVLMAAMFGSALTLASFVKVLHSVFLGQPKKPRQEGRSPGALMKVPMLVLAGLCVVLGVFAVQIGVRWLILPLPGITEAEFNQSLAGEWSSRGAAALIIVALVIGGLIYLFSTFSRVREDEAYIGGEVGERAEGYDFEGVEFYGTVRDLPFLRGLYRQSEARWYDLYEQCRRLTFYVSGWLRKLHNGSLHNYVTWCVLGLVVILWWLLYTFRILGRAF